jgi:sugar/nucleoside kinase (ribokinase family)
VSEAGPLLCVVGDLVEDVVVWPAQAVVIGTDNPCVVRRTRGGSAANVAAVAAAHVATRFVGCVGDDAAGDGLERALAATGVEVCLERRDRTGSVVVIVDPTGERTMFPDRAAATRLSSGAVRWVADVDVLHIPAYAFDGGTTADAVVAMAAAVRSHGGRVTVDASAASLVGQLGAPRFLELVAELGATLLFANRDEANALGLHVASPPSGLTTIVKDGPRPVRIVTAGAPVVEVAAEAVADVRDTTGAGDAFAAGTLAAWMGGADLAAACRAGHRLAAGVLGTPGAGGQPPRPPADGGPSVAHPQGASL